MNHTKFTNSEFFYKTKIMHKYLSLIIILIISLSCQNIDNTKILIKDKTCISQLKEAYIFAYPLVIMEITKRFSINNKLEGAAINHFFHKKEFPDHTFRKVVKPNNDTYYSTAWLDLKTQPIILTVPATDRYYLLPLYDAWTNVFASPGTRTTGTKAQSFLIAGTDWKGVAPDGMKVFRSTTNMAYIIGRTQVNSLEDGKKVVSKIQDGFNLVPLDKWGKDDQLKERKIDENISTKAPKLQIKELAIDSFFNLFNQLLLDNPVDESEKIFLEKLKKFNIGANQHFSITDFSNELQTDIKTIPKQVHLEFPKLFKAELVNGWRTLLDLGNYGKDYKKRAFIAHYGLGANLSEDTVYPTGLVDADGQAFHGKNKYLLHFPKGQLPPGKAFWSLTMYNNSAFLVRNPIQRFAIGDRDNLKYNEDGSLDIWIQEEAPESKKMSNWLPAPSDKFMLTMRIYWPEESVLEDKWTAPAVRKILD